jgi:ketopantoate hydroxymethyltransferase
MTLRHSRQFAHVGDVMRDAFTAYVAAVQEGSFPTDDNVRHLARAVYESLPESEPH